MIYNTGVCSTMKLHTFYYKYIPIQRYQEIRLRKVNSLPLTLMTNEMTRVVSGENTTPGVKL